MRKALSTYSLANDCFNCAKLCASPALCSLLATAALMPKGMVGKLYTFDVFVCLLASQY